MPAGLIEAWPVPAMPINCAGNAAVKPALIGAAPVLVTVAVTPTIPPGPKHIKGSSRASERLIGGGLTLIVNVAGAPLCGVQLTVVVPIGKSDPDGSEQVTMPQPPVVVGVG